MFKKNHKLSAMRFGMILVLLIGMLGATPTMSVLASTIMVTTTSDSGAGSLRQAIADAVSGDTIRFDPSLAGQTITLASNLVIDKDLTIDGSGLSPQLTINGGDIAHWEIPSGSTVTISDVTITDGNYGILVRGNLTIINTTLKDNVDYSGGAISTYNGSLTIENSTITQNYSNYGGGAIFVGGMGHARIVNSTVTNNEANLNGGGILLQESATAEIINSTFADNSASDGSEISMIGSSSLIVSNSIFVCAPTNTSCYDYSPGSVVSTNSILGVGTLADFGLGALAGNGGPTQTMALLPGSPAIDAGDNANCPATDQRGVARPQGAGCDIGAYEYDYTGIYYSKPIASGNGNCQSWENACTLQSALATATSGDEIWVAAGIYKPDGVDPGNRDLTFQLKNGVAIYGGFAGTESAREERDLAVNVTTLSGDLSGNDVGFENNTENSYHVVTGSGTDNTAVLDGFTVIGGNANGSYPFGGGMYNDGGSPTLTGITFSGNTASYGSGMANEDSSSPTLTNIIFSGNAAQGGGGMYNNNSSPTLTDVTFSGNIASGYGYGGGMDNYQSSPILRNVTFSGNVAETGGGMYNFTNSSPTLTNVTFRSNTASLGGGMYNIVNSNPTLTNVTFSSNTASYSLIGNGGGMYNTVSSNPVLTNVILWENTAPTGSQVYNDGSTPGISHSVVQGGCPEGSTCANIVTSDPKLGMLGDYGGNTQTIPLLSGSPAIDAGNDANCPATDQRGIVRPQGSHCDIGAYEYIDTTPPTVISILRANADHTFASSVNFTVTFSEPVMDVDTTAPFNDFTLTTTGITGASITEVSGSGATRTVTVNTGSGNGAIRLDVPVTANITDLSGNLLAGLPFIDGQVYTIEKTPTLPGTATLVSPIGSIGTNTPVYTWNVVPGSTWYYLWINGPSGNIFKQWYTAIQANCNDTTCSVTPSDLTLSSGNYTWWVQTWNEAGYGPWSAGMSFSVPLPPLPGQATLVSPSGSLDNNNPSYTWNKVSASTWYYLSVSGPSGYAFTKWYDASVVCGASTCSVAGATPNLVGGAYIWKVQTWNSTGYGPWSAEMSFNTSVPPGAAILVAPNGTTTDPTPDYTWNEVSGATWYYLWVNGPSGNVIQQWYDASAVCSGGTCTVTPTTTLASGAHSWWVRTWNSAGYGPWSDAMTFSFALPGKATLNAPMGSSMTTTPTYNWNEVPGATWYYLWVNNTFGGNVIKKWYQASTVCSGGFCAVTPTPSLSAGVSYTWWVQTWNEAGYGPWSDPLSFTVIALP